MGLLDRIVGDRQVKHGEDGEAPADEAMLAVPTEEHGASTGEIVWRTERRRIGDLIEWDKNPRRLTEKQAADLKASLERFGYVEEIVVNADGRSIIGGHMRRRVALEGLLDADAIVDVRVPSRSLSEAEGIELAIRLNKNLGEWDWDVLANDFDVKALSEWGFLPKELGVGPDFTPVTAEQQGKLDQKAQVTCPQCGHEFVPQ